MIETAPRRARPPLTPPLTTARGAALYIGALLGPGLLLLPGRAAGQCRRPVAPGGPAGRRGRGGGGGDGGIGPRGQLDAVRPAWLVRGGARGRGLDAVLRRLGGGRAAHHRVSRPGPAADPRGG